MKVIGCHIKNDFGKIPEIFLGKWKTPGILSVLKSENPEVAVFTRHTLALDLSYSKSRGRTH